MQVFAEECNRHVIIMYGALDVLDRFAFEMAKGRDGTLLVDYKNHSDVLSSIMDEIDEKTVVITFNSIGANIPLWRVRNVKLYNIIVDHPAFYLQHITELYYSNMHTVCVDKKHVGFLQKVMPSIKDRFFSCLMVERSVKE